jgi:hypothetical protein
MRASCKARRADIVAHIIAFITDGASHSRGIAYRTVSDYRAVGARSILQISAIRAGFTIFGGIAREIKGTISSRI